MNKITSVQNPLIKKITALHTKKGRQEQQVFIAEGKRICATLIATGMRPKYFFTTEKMFDITGKLLPNYETLTMVTDNVMKKISTTKTPSGILGVFEIPYQKETTLEKGIVLAQITDPGNMGSLIRSAAAFGLNTVVCIDSCDPWSPKVVQATAGTIALINLHQITWKELLQNKKDLQLSALVVSGGKKPVDLQNKNCLLVIGSEAHGIPKDWQKDCKQKVTLPMPGKIESLNAAVAGSIALYQIFVGD